ncbi:hypothetical protein N9948_00380 [bacterium]|nr:hypothetical protein [bacterium]
MEANIIYVEYLNNSLETLYRTHIQYIPNVGKRVWLNDKAYEVTDVEPYFYTLDCKQNKVRVYLEPTKED